jgi:hypothetical protein
MPEYTGNALRDFVSDLFRDNGIQTRRAWAVVFWLFWIVLMVLAGVFHV